jgi:hypothetical protein
LSGTGRQAKRVWLSKERHITPAWLGLIAARIIFYSLSSLREGRGRRWLWGKVLFIFAFDNLTAIRVLTDE